MARFHASRAGLLLALGGLLPHSATADIFSGLAGMTSGLTGLTTGATTGLTDTTNLTNGLTSGLNGLTNGLAGATAGVTAGAASATQGAVTNTAQSADGTFSNVANQLGASNGQLGDSVPGQYVEAYTGGQVENPNLEDNLDVSGLGALGAVGAMGGGTSLLSASALSNGLSALGANMAGGQTQNLGQGLTWNFGGTGMTNVLVGMFMGYVTGQADPNSAINVVGDAFVNQDPSIIAQAFTDLITSLDLACGFQMTASGDTRYGVNMNFRDGKEALNIQFIPTISNSIFRFSGQFPTATAFSYSSFLVSDSGKITHIDTLDGRDMSANMGNNPFRNGVSSLATSGTYDVYASPTGNVTGLNPRQMKNQFAYNNKGLVDSMALIIVYRVVMDDRVINQDNWGSVPPPKLAMNPSAITGSSGLFLNVPACRTESNNDKIRTFVNDQVLAATSSGSVSVKCNYYNVPNNFVFFDGAQYFRQPDENHITSCADTTKLSSGQSELVTVIQGTLPPADKARYVSISLTDLYPPGANIRTITGSSLRDYLRTRSLSGQGNYTIIMAKSRTVLNRCRLTNLPSDYFQVFYTTTASKWPGVIYREIMTDNYPESVENVRSACEDVKQCDNPRYFEGAMGKFYPSVAYLECNTATGVLTYAPVPNTTWPEPDLPTPSPTALWGKLDEKGQLGPCAPKGHMNVTSYQGQEIYIDGKLAGKLTQNGKVVSQAVSRGWSAVWAEYATMNSEVSNATTNQSTQVTYLTDKVITTPKMSNFMPDEVVFGVRVPITDAMNVPGFFADLDLCGYEQRSGAGWKCATGIQGNNWTMPGFRDDDWRPARTVSYRKACASNTGMDCTNVAPGSQAIWLDVCPGASQPKSGSLTCRLVVPQKCDLSCKNGSPDRVKAFCPDRHSAVGSSLAASPALFWLYANGKLVNQDLTANSEPVMGLFPLGHREPLITLAVKAADGSKKSSKGFFAGSFSLCGWEVNTDVAWKCSPTEPLTDDWKLPTFDDSKWLPASIKDNGVLTPKAPAGISSSASWIWGPQPQVMWCRVTLANPVFVNNGMTATQ